MRALATIHRAKAVELESRARDIEAAARVEPGPFLCAGHFKHLHHPGLRQTWAGGRPDETAVAATVDYLEHHQPGHTGACLACRPGSQHT
jgi:hypothetical protein